MLESLSIQACQIDDVNWKKTNEHCKVESYITIKKYNLVNFARTVCMFGYCGLLFSIPVYLQTSLGLSPLFTGLIILIMTAVIASLSFMVGRWLDSVGADYPIII